MKWKQFLKPDWRKIVIFIILSVFISLLGLNFTSIFNLYQIENIFVAIIFSIIFLLPSFVLKSIQFIISLYYANILSPLEFGTLKASGTLTNLFLIFSIFGWVLDIIYWYILSCLIVLIYDKFRKKKK